MFRKEKIYIAGPECFYQNGQMVLKSMCRRAESLYFMMKIVKKASAA